MCGILQWIITSNEGFSVMQEDMAANLRPGFTVSRFARPGGSSYEYDFLLGETKAPGESWGTYADHTVCAGNDNDTKNTYGMLQIGFEIQFYKYENYHFEAIGGRMHLVNDEHNVTDWSRHMKSIPMPVVNHKSDRVIKLEDQW
ncbi:Uncharacterized protein BP5553_08783 [Venustampulla echinocandica]|uniref:Uncharacterized protein n=1 Tax=Venustampulla echinocandica TaxID=2656787 RepID=A0A370TF80_9HELO|nr:Uncharacterized protein BP5553_08783 [Venustampulla echinocandica]RDL33344.1 Uncharacterized protein BP5553_08783 [Venustampulla echinocandica]